MSDTTTNLELPFILPAQAQKHVTHNEALLRLDALVHLTIIDEQAAPPATPAEGEGYLVAASPTGDWAGKAGKLAFWQDGYWSFIQPRTGWRAWFISLSQAQVFNGSLWQNLPLPDTAAFDQLGINASADSTNRLAVSSAASLFNNAGAGHQIKVNKAIAGDTASLLFQTNWTGYAEMGLTGSNEFAVKVSDGTTWKTGISISSAGHVSRPNQPVMRAYRSGTSFTPTAGQQSGFTNFAIEQGGFSFGSAAAGGGNSVLIPATGNYLIALNVAIVTSSGHGVEIILNGSQIIASLNGSAGGTQSQSTVIIQSLSAGDVITLGHSGTAQIELGATRTELSMTML